MSITLKSRLKMSPFSSVVHCHKKSVVCSIIVRVCLLRLIMEIQTCCSLRVLLHPTHQCTTCRLLLLESLPKGLFVDLYQADAMVKFGGPKIVAFEDIDLEKPAYLSKEHTVLVYPSGPSHIVHLHPANPFRLDEDAMVNFTTEMSVHLRYQRPSVDTQVLSARVFLPAPYLLLRCRESSSGGSHTAIDDVDGKTYMQLSYKAPCDGTRQTLCTWQLLPLTNRENKKLHFDVPVGQTSHTFVVAMVTILATAVGTVVLLVVMSRSHAKNKPD